MQDNSIKSQFDKARQCHPVLIGHWVAWVSLQLDKPCDAATLLELKALRAELEARMKDAEPAQRLSSVSGPGGTKPFCIGRADVCRA